MDLTNYILHHTHHIIIIIELLLSIALADQFQLCFLTQKVPKSASAKTFQH